MKLKFEPDVDSNVPPPSGARLIDPEAYDASEQSFAASLNEASASPKFVADDVQDLSSNQRAANELPSLREPVDLLTPSQSSQSEPVNPPDLDSWRNEVADRVNNYRARRRPRAPRYPSLQLKFDPPEPSWNDHPATMPPAAPNRLAVAVQDNSATRPEQIHIQPATDDAFDVPEAGGRILEFPRFAPPLPVFDGIAEPVVEQPRILEVPDLLPPPPALGGIMMDPVEEPAQERRPGFELPLQAAPMSRRLLASAIDAFLVMSAFALFAYIFFRVTTIAPPLQLAATTSIILIAVFWTCLSIPSAGLYSDHPGPAPGAPAAEPLRWHCGSQEDATLARTRCRVVGIIVGAGLRLVLPRRGSTLLARSHHSHVYGPATALPFSEVNRLRKFGLHDGHSGNRRRLSPQDCAPQ